jgi:hypothetical protein
LIALFRENPVGIDYEVAGLTQKDLTLLQKTAWRARKSIR